MNETKKKRYALVISLLVLMICVVGSTYAYFALTASNNNISGKVGGTSLDLTVTRILPTAIEDDDMMIPQLEGSLDKAISEDYNCVDDNGKLVCQVYEATVTNLGSESVTLNGNISFTGIENMPNLKWKLLTDSRTIDSSATSKNASLSEVSFVEDLTLTTEQTTKTKTYYFVFWIEETGELQTDNGEFRVIINFNSPNAESGVTSTITSNEGITYPIKATDLVSTLYNDGSTINTVHIGGDTSKPEVSLNNVQRIMLDNNGEYRYYGNDLEEDTANGKYLTKNYVSFNGELWRIISSSKVFSNEEDTTGDIRLRIIRDESIGYHAWDQDTDGDGTDTENNNWETSTLNATLNGIYYNGTSGTCYMAESVTDTGTATTCDYGSGTIKGLSSEVRNLIDDSVWYLGGNNASLYANDFYTFERGTTVSTEGYPTSTVAKLGIMYPSDYTYATDLNVCTKTGSYYSGDEKNCTRKDWLFNSAYQWLISPYSGNSSYAFGVDHTGYVYYSGIDDFYVYLALEVRPVAVLKPNVMITGGSGTSGDPYILSLGE